MQSGAGAALPILAGVGIGVATGNPMIGMAVASGGSALMSGVSGYQAGQMEADQMKSAAKDAEVQGQQRANEIRRQLMSTLGTQEAMLASRGVTLGTGGTPDTLAAEANRAFAEDLRVNRYNTLTERGAMRSNASQARTAGNASLISGISDAGMAGFTAWDEYSSLGKVPQTRSPASRGRPRPLVIPRG